MLLAFTSGVLEHALSAEEHNQILQTIEMFEAITQTQPEDYQSLEILKEAYTKIGRHDDSLKVSRKLAESYFNSGSYTPALRECEVILTRQPNSPEIVSMLSEIEQRLQATGQAIVEKDKQQAASNLANGPFTKADGSLVSPTTDGSLIDVDPARGKGLGRITNLHERGDDHLAKFLIVQQLFTEEQVHSALETTKEANKDLPEQAMGVSMLDRLCRDKPAQLEPVLSALIDRTKFAFVPLEYYDVDRQIAPMLPEYLTLGRLFVPFDLVSRTIMVACCNPFDSAGRDAVQQSVDYTVSWYLARPAAITQTLRAIYRLDSKS
jgi:Type II secretion system (T2SS), protein E, N-terminal domain